MKRDTGGPGSASEAWALGRLHNDLALLERAARMVPGDPRVRLDLATARLAQGDAKGAAEIFEDLVRDHESREIWLGLAMAKFRLGEVLEAAAALENLLTRHCVAPEPAFLAFALRVARQAGYGGIRYMAPEAVTPATLGEGRILGETPDLAALRRTEGLVAVAGGGLQGWASRPGAPEMPPQLLLRDAAGKILAVPFSGVLETDETAPFLKRHRFRLSAARLKNLAPPFTLAGLEGNALMGSPVHPALLAATSPQPASWIGAPPKKIPPRAKLAILIPLYRGLEETRACLNSVLAAAPEARIILVDDAIPEPELRAWAQHLARSRPLTLIRHARNLGFPAAVNSGLAAAPGHDILLLNSDTLIPPGAIEILAEAAYARADTGTVTPWSNAATICSYPDPDGGPMPDAAGIAAAQALAAHIHGRKTHEIPTAIGCCMFIRQDCLAATGPFRPEFFAQGYGEENDFCLRARHLGYRHVIALGAYVGHRGGVSFRAARQGLTARNLAVLEKLFPGYRRLAQGFIKADPLAPARRALDEARITARDAPAVLLVSHSHGGGVARQVAAQMAQLRAAGTRALLLTTKFPKNPLATPYPWPALLCEGETEDYPNLAYDLAREFAALVALLRRLNVQKIVLHHALGHHAQVRELARALGVKQDIIIHDYACFCPRVNLLRRSGEAEPPRYCGEPAPEECASCVARDKADVYEPLAIPALLARSAREFAEAGAIIAPSADAARRITRHFPGVTPRVTPWEDDTAPLPLTPPGQGPQRRIAVIGGIGPSKGFELLRECGLDAAARNLALDFIVIGRSAEDAKLLETGRIFITGGYREGEARHLIAKARPDLAFFPSIWPETWCFALSEAWAAGLYTLVFNLGAQAERVQATGRGAILPLGLPPARLNDTLLRWQPPIKNPPA